MSAWLRSKHLAFSSAPASVILTSRSASLPYRKSRPRPFCSAMSADATSTTAQNVSEALKTVRARVTAASASAGRDAVELVAVSKTKPTELLMAAYDANQRHFGENYVQELVGKAPELPGDIKWHYIGALQSNKAKTLLSVPNLHVVESVDREKVAKALDKAAASSERSEPLRVMVQVNTSGEESKAGCEPGETATLATYVDRECKSLELVGLMTIGAPDTSEEPEAFKVLAREREVVAKELGKEEKSLRLSMGMSADFEAAIRMGSDSVRVGSTIFGAREYPPK